MSPAWRPTLVATPDPSVIAVVSRRRRVHRLEPARGALTRLGATLAVPTTSERLLTPLRRDGEAIVCDHPPGAAVAPLHASFTLDGGWWGLRLGAHPLLLHLPRGADAPMVASAAPLQDALRRAVGPRPFDLVGAAPNGGRVVLALATGPGAHALVAFHGRALLRWRDALDALDPLHPPEVTTVQPLLTPTARGPGWTASVACRLGGGLAMLATDPAGALAVILTRAGRARVHPLAADPADVLGLCADPHHPDRLRALVRAGRLRVPELWTLRLEAAPVHARPELPAHA